ncbi:MAG: benzoate-CoA ligase family protein [Gammaproteobacteria bacterium]|nr:benzoate-CoA ligase family protein [Gammaproteobacteria bacterium]
MNYNAANELLVPNLVGERGARTAFIDKDGPHTYTEVADLAGRFANLLLRAGIEPEQRVLLALHDTVAFPVCFLGAMQAGIVPIPLNTLLTRDDYAFIAEDSGASAFVAAGALVERLPEDAALLKFTVDGDGGRNIWAELRDSPADWRGVQAGQDDVAFWLYTSGTTGRPKGVMHSHGDLLATAENYGRGILKLSESDVCFSAAKFFFAYGLGNSLTFPMSVGATVLLLEAPPTPDAVVSILNEYRPTIFFGVPTLYAMLLNTDNVPRNHRIRHCVSAGEALPEAIFDRWREATGVEILDGIGSTEMLHIYMSNRTGDVQPGTSGTPVSNYQVKLLDDTGAELTEAGEIGDLYVTGPSMTRGYWNRPELNQATFDGTWMCTGDKYQRTESGAYRYCGRSDDLLKVGGIYVSPMEVENALLAHQAVAEAAVVGHEDDDELVKPKAFVVAAEGNEANDALAKTLIDHVAGRLAAYKRPRWVEFVDTLPKTATGKIQRYKLRT